MPTGNFQFDFTVASGNTIVEVLNVRSILESELKAYQLDYLPILGEFVVEGCDIATNITSINSAPIADIDKTIDSKSEQAAKIHAIWSNYPKIGMQLYLDIGNGAWKKQGQPIVIQNKPFQLPIEILRPYLSATNNFKLLGKKARLGGQILTGSGWQQLSGVDYVSVKGDWRFTVSFQEKITKAIENVFPIALNLAENVAQTVRPANQNRRLLVLTNDGQNKIYVYFGDVGTVSLLTGIPIEPGDTINFLEYKAYIGTQISAICPVGTSRLIGMEGTISGA